MFVTSASGHAKFSPIPVPDFENNGQPSDLQNRVPAAFMQEVKRALNEPMEWKNVLETEENIWIGKENVTSVIHGLEQKSHRRARCKYINLHI